MSCDEKRKLVETAFDGKDSKGSRFGVYVSKTGTGKQKEFPFTIIGTFQEKTLKGKLPITTNDLHIILGIDSSEVKDYDPFRAKELNLCSKRDAYHRLGDHQ